jgi:hypothetical protein
LWRGSWRSGEGAGMLVLWEGVLETSVAASVVEVS